MHSNHLGIKTTWVDEILRRAASLPGRTGRRSRRISRILRQLRGPCTMVLSWWATKAVAVSNALGDWMRRRIINSILESNIDKMIYNMYLNNFEHMIWLNAIQSTSDNWLASAVASVVINHLKVRVWEEIQNPWRANPMCKMLPSRCTGQPNPGKTLSVWGFMDSSTFQEHSWWL
jgi:hypothetical protein